MTVMLPREQEHKSSANLFLERAPLTADEQRQALRERLWRDMAAYEAAGGKITYCEAGESGEQVTHQLRQSINANCNRVVNDKTLTAKEKQAYRRLEPHVDANGLVKIAEAMTGMNPTERGNFYAYVNKIGDKGYLRRGEKKGYIRLIRSIDDENTVRAGK